MKSLIIFLGVFVVFSCKAQQTYPLNTDFDEIPQNSYLKDLNNELDTYVGTYTGTYNGNHITLFINKEIKKYFDLTSIKIFRDVLSVRFIIKNSSQIILQDTQNMNFQNNQIKNTIYSTVTNPYHNLLMLSYGGTNCGVGWGSIRLKKLNSTQISWEYIPNSTIIDSNKCPSGTDINIYLPETKDLIFTKQ